jgi:transposase
VKDIIDERIRESEVSYHDETGARVEGKLHWVMVAASDMWVKYWVNPKRGDVMKGLTNIMSRDGFKSYDSANPEACMALCNAHILRELEAAKLLDRETDRECWASKMQRILLLMNRVKNRYQKLNLKIPSKMHEGLVSHYDKILFDAMYEIGAGEKVSPLLVRLIKRKSDIIRFFNENSVPFTNNYAERLIRMLKVKLKVSGCFRKLSCAENFMDIRSVLMTLKQQGGNLVQSIQLSLTKKIVTFPALSPPQ